MGAIDRDILYKSLICVIVSLWLYWLWSRRGFYKFALTFPGVTGLPIIGSIYKAGRLKNIMKIIGKLFDDSKSHTFCGWLGLDLYVTSKDPEFIEKILSSPDMLNKCSFYDHVRDITQDGLIDLPAKEWQNHRKLINPSFNHNVLVNFSPIFNKAKNLAVQKLNSMTDNEEHKLAKILERITLAVSVESTMGHKMKEGNEADENMAETLSFVLEKLVMQAILSGLKLHGLFRFYGKFQQKRAEIQKFVRQIVEKKFKKLNEINEVTKTVTGESKKSEISGEGEALVAIKKEPIIFIDQALRIYQKQQFSLNDIVGESTTLVFAAFETTALGVFSTLVMLAMHPDVQERLYEEIFNEFPEKTFEMEYSDMEKLPYLDMVIKETLRILPPVALIGRTAAKDTQLSADLWFPKDIQIILSIYHLHRRTDIWGPNATKFDPDHFLPQNLAEKHSHAYMPFSKGMRNCIGYRYAMFSMKTLIAGLLRNYRFTTSTRFEDLQLTFKMTLKYLNEPMFKLHERQ